MLRGRWSILRTSTFRWLAFCALAKYCFTANNVHLCPCLHPCHCSSAVPSASTLRSAGPSPAAATRSAPSVFVSAWPASCRDIVLLSVHVRKSYSCCCGRTQFCALACLATTSPTLTVIPSPRICALLHPPLTPLQPHPPSLSCLRPTFCALLHPHSPCTLTRPHSCALTPCFTLR